MKPRPIRTACLICLMFTLNTTPTVAAAAPDLAAPAPLTWQRLPSLPDREGFAGSFAGVSCDALLVGGGANFPDQRPWEGGTKTWYDSVFVLEKPDGDWRLVGRLPRALGYGVALTTPRGVACLGGSDAERHHTDCFLLRWEHGDLKTVPLPPLPRSVANACGALLGQTLYVAGGIETPAATNALLAFYALDLAEASARWRELEPWPGPARMLAVASAAEGSFFLLGGAALRAGPDGKTARDWLRDGYRFTPGQGWQRLADLPRVSVAAPSPASVLPGPRLVVVGGDDGALVNFEPKEKHPGFPRSMLVYDLKANQWSTAGEVPFSLVTTPSVEWRGHVVVPGGEARPGVRSPQVWWAKLP